jgi:hypothetical protein
MSYYGIRIFDDLDQYLPALLYDTGRFTSVQDVLQYIRQQARYHMNRFDRAHADFQQHSRHQRRNQGRRPQPPPVPQAPQEAAAANDLFQQLFGTLLGGEQTPLTVLTTELHTMPLNMESVIVRPTARQLEDGSELDTPTSPFILAEGETCTICQEVLEPGSLRRLRHCRHAFHRACIDTWFLRHVRCPICRHDIREN